MKDELPTSRTTANQDYPRWLILSFAGGVLVGMIGVAVFLLGHRLAGTMMFTSGLLSAVLALLRGEDLDARRIENHD